MAKVAVIGSGTAGLITAYTLVQDGFDVEVLTRDRSAGGVWSKDRVYEGLTINSVHGAYEFSPLPMPPPENSAKTGGRLSGQDVMLYMETFANRFLKARIKYRTTVESVTRTSKGWTAQVTVEGEAGVKTKDELHYDKLVLCTGGCHHPHIPETLSPVKAAKAKFSGPVLHSSQFASKAPSILSSTAPRSTPETGSIVVIGGGKSAQDVSAYLANQGRQVSVVFEKADAALAAPIPLPRFIRNSRFLSILSPHINLRSRLERWLHLTPAGATLVRAIWSFLTRSTFDVLKIPTDSPLRNAHPLFWGVRTNDEGNGHPHGFFANVAQGKINLVAPARVHGFSGDGSGLTLEDGRTLPADLVVAATGYESSWAPLLDEATQQELGMGRHPPPPLSSGGYDWNYASMNDPPEARPAAAQQASSMYMALVPAKNIRNRDFAVNGSVFTTNNAYAWELASHWISSYFMGDTFLKVPSPEQAQEHAERTGAWLRKRYPDALVWANESHSSDIAFWTWPQWTDDLLEDMNMKIYRSGGNWITWPFKVIDVKEIAHLGEERRMSRMNRG